jgi:hypothetical protein
MVHSLWLHQKEHIHGTSSATTPQFHRSQNCISLCSTYNVVKQIATSLTTLCWTTRNFPHHLFETSFSSCHPSLNAVSMKLLIHLDVTPKHLTHTGALLPSPSWTMGCHPPTGCWLTILNSNQISEPGASHLSPFPNIISPLNSLSIFTHRTSLPYVRGFFFFDALFSHLLCGTGVESVFKYMWCASVLGYSFGEASHPQYTPLEKLHTLNTRFLPAAWMMEDGGE